VAAPQGSTGRRLEREPFDRDGWLFELKWDGFGAIAATDGAGKVSLYSQKQDEFNNRRRKLRRWLATAVAAEQCLGTSERD
jgi:ATP-dependent DNA ligase